MREADFKEEFDWFSREAHGADRIEPLIRRPLVFALLKLAELVGFSFRVEVLRASAWAQCHPPKRRWDRFYLNWFRRAEPDGKVGTKQFNEDVERFK